MSRFIRDRSTVCLSFITNVFIWEGGCLGDKAKGCAGRVQFCAEARLSALEGGGGEAIIGVTVFLWDRFWW